MRFERGRLRIARGSIGSGGGGILVLLQQLGLKPWCLVSPQLRAISKDGSDFLVWQLW